MTHGKKYMKIEIDEKTIEKLLAWGFGPKQNINKRDLEKVITTMLTSLAEENLGYLLTSDNKKLRLLADLSEENGITINFFEKYKRVMRARSRERNKTTMLKNGIGLTGGIATGKSTISELLKVMGVRVIDADQLSREVVLPGSKTLERIVSAFGRGILNPKGELDRAKMRAIVFNDENKRKILEKITHPAIEDLLFSKLGNTSSLWIYESAILYETGFASKLGEMWVASCSEQTQVQRVMQRDGATEEEAKQAISIQMPMEEKRQRADVIINTDILLSDLKSNVRSELFKALK